MREYAVEISISSVEINVPNAYAPKARAATFVGTTSEKDSLAVAMALRKYADALDGKVTA